MYKVTIEREGCEPVYIESEEVIVIGTRQDDSGHCECQMVKGISDIMEYINLISFGTAKFIKDVAGDVPCLQKRFRRSIIHDIGSQTKKILRAMSQ